MNKLEAARACINEIDKEMAELFVRRMEAVGEVAEYKRERGLTVLDTSREREVVGRNSLFVEDETLRSYYTKFITDLMSLSRSYQTMLLEGARVAYSGTVGAFSHIMASRLFPSSKKIAYPTFEAAYASVVSGECDCAVLPTENSYNGEVGQVSDLMFSGPLFVSSVNELAVTQDLVALPGADITKIKRVVSHPQALGQCAEYIKARGLSTAEYENTALAAKYVSELGDPSVAAIASAEAAEMFGLCVLERNINSSRTNTTRFAVFSRAEHIPSPTETDVHTILLFTVRNEAGALARAIQIIGKHGFNMRALRSRPMKELLWQYYFYVEAEGNLNTDEGQAMMEELSCCCDRLRAIGSYTKM